jgi:hypothetical protein
MPEPRHPLLAKLAEVGSAACAYSWDAAAWPHRVRCDCKYGGPNPASPWSEQTGCPELREAYERLEANLQRSPDA